MKNSKSLLLLPLAFACFLLSSTAAKADIVVTLDSPYQVGISNQYTFTGTLANNDPSATVFLNGDSFLLDSPLTFDDSDFNNNVPLFLDPFASSGDIELFTIYLPEGTPIGLYTGTYLLQGGADAIIIPSRFEPCGLTQLYGLRYGCVSIAARTGGLADTIIDANEAALAAGIATGFLFDGLTPEGLTRAIQRAIALFGDREAWRVMQKRGMKADFSWKRSGQRYADLYKHLLKASPKR